MVNSTINGYSVQKKLVPVLTDVLLDAVKIILLRALPFRATYFQISKESDSSCTNLLLHAEVRWLSRGQNLRTLLLLNHEIEIFSLEQQCELPVFFSKCLMT